MIEVCQVEMISFHYKAFNVFQGRIVEIDAAPIKEEQIKEVVKTNMMSDNTTKDCSTSENTAKEEMEALAENEELIRDWLDDTV